MPAGGALKTAESQPRAFHATEYLMNRPEGQRALREFREMKAAGAFPASKSAEPAHAVGAQEFFAVYNFDTESYDNINFTLKTERTRYTIWVETALLSGTVSDSQINTLDEALGTSTPAGSFDPGQGIIVNDEVIFGDPPNVDGDSKTDIMLLDIRDDASQGFVVLGFFDPRDLSASGNNRDMVYLDTDPGLNSLESLLATAAHEYQHLIMANYDGLETTFVNEAQSEWAEVMNGYDGRDMDFLTTAGEHLTRFFSYRSETGGILDRERGQLFTLYLAEQHGPQIAGAITRQTSRAHQGYGATDVLGSVATFENLLVDFHVANLYNDTGLGSKYGYTNPFYTNVRTNPDLIIDGRVQTSVDSTQIHLSGGTVRYVDFLDVKDLVLTVDVNPSNPNFIPSYRDRTAVRALLESGGEPLQEIAFTPDGSDLLIPGTFDRVRVVIVNKRAQEPATPVVPIFYRAMWQSEASGQLVDILYDDGNPSRDYFSTDGTFVMVTNFEVPDPDRATLDLVQLAPFYDNQFLSTTLPESAPRDIRFLVLDQTAGVPDLSKEIFSLVVEDPRPFSQVLTNSPLNHFDLDLGAYSAQLSNLPANVYIGYSDTGTDANFQVVGPAINSTDNVSYIGQTNNTGWIRLWDTTPSGSCCNNRVFPVRARFLVADPVVSVDAPPVAGDVTLHPNYPNPFTSRTEIVFEVATPTRVVVRLFDVLGREVAVATDAQYPSGVHRVPIDGSRLSSGTYFYSLESNGHRATRAMTRF